MIEPRMLYRRSGSSVDRSTATRKSTGTCRPARSVRCSAIASAGIVGALGAAKGLAIGFGMLLHLRRVHSLVAVLTAIYFAVAILPWATLFFFATP